MKKLNLKRRVKENTKGFKSKGLKNDLIFLQLKKGKTPSKSLSYWTSQGGNRSAISSTRK